MLIRRGEFAELAAVSILAKISATITAVAPVIGVVIGVVLVVTVAVVVTTTKTTVQEKDEKSTVYTDINNDDDDDTVIYRYGDVFYPTSKEMYSFNGSSPGVSFALKPPTNTNTPYSVTTLNTLNNSGIFTAEVDGANHVSVRPTGVYGSMQSCYCDGENHPYSYALKGMTIKMK